MCESSWPCLSLPAWSNSSRNLKCSETKSKWPALGLQHKEPAGEALPAQSQLSKRNKTKDINVEVEGSGNQQLPKNMGEVLRTYARIDYLYSLLSKWQAFVRAGKYLFLLEYPTVWDWKILLSFNISVLAHLKAEETASIISFLPAGWYWVSRRTSVSWPPAVLSVTWLSLSHFILTIILYGMDLYFTVYKWKM